MSARRALWRKAGAPKGAARLGGALVGESRLRNGLRVIVAERHEDPVVSTLLYYRVGSRDETERVSGVSHFLEHMMFKGSARFGKGEVDRITTELGGQNNAFTSQDHTAYWFELASDRWETALELEADRMRELRLDPDEFAAEREVVLDELAMGEDEPWRVLTRRVSAALFPRHPYRWPIIGFPETLRSLSVEDMRAHYASFYRPSNALLVVAGDVTRPAALRAARAHFGSIDEPPRREAPAPLRILEEPAGETRIAMTWPDAGRRLALAWPTSPVLSDDDYTLDVMAVLLTEGRNSRLQRRLVLDGGLATSLSASNEAMLDTGSFWILAECSQGGDPAALEAELAREVQRLADELVPAPELARARAILRADDAFDRETVTDLSEKIGEYAADGDWRMALDGGARHARVTPERIRECARRLLSPRRRIVGWSLPA